VLQRIWVHLRPHRRQVGILVALLVLDAGLTAGIPLGIKFLVDAAIVPRDRRLLVLLLSALGGATLISFAAAIGRDWLYARLGTGVLNDFRLALFDQLQRLSASFYARSRGGDLIARFTTDLQALEGVVTTVLPWGMMAVLTIGASLVVMFALQWQLALLALLSVPLSLIGPRMLGSRAAGAGYDVKVHEGRITGTVQEALAGQYVVRAFGLESRARLGFVERLTELGVHSRRFTFLTGLVQRTPNLAVGLIHVAILATAAVLAFRGLLTVGSLLSFDLVFLNFSGGVASLTEVAPSFLRASGSLARIEELLAEEPSVRDPEHPRLLPRLTKAITFRNVAAGYGPDHPILADIDLEIARGSRVAFVGRSGSGKSTILNLLLRFHDPTSGAVMIDGIDLREARQADVRRQMAVVSQEGFLFDASIRENLLAVRLASDDELRAAARAVEALGFIEELPGGFDAPVGERGSRLSGGQRQRLAIARALLADPEILLLDEATSALDAATEAAVEEALAAVMKGRTVISVTHRLRSIADVDRIFVLDGGRIVEQGRHAELMPRGGVYAEMWRKQNGLEIGEDGTTASITAERLRLTPLLRDLEPELLEELTRRFGSEQVPADRLVLAEGDPGDRFYIIARGQVSVSKRDGVGGARVVGRLESGDHFGEVALLSDVPRTATVRTVTPSMFLTLQRAHFLELVERVPGLRSALESVQAQRTAAESPAVPVG
jgi:ATP-binding cassette subfamily B protein